MKNQSLFSRRIVLILFIGMFITGCGVWTDFTTYFNLYYNTTVFLEKAELEIEKEPKDIFEFRELPVPATAKQNLTKVIEKCSNILQFNSESSYVDDALFMIGKAFYYQESYSRAIRKFLELLSQEENSLTLEAELWLGKSKLQMREFDEGLEILESVKEKSLLVENDDIYNEATIRQISYWIYREEYTNAIAMCEDLISSTDNDELISETLFKLGEIHVIIEDYDKALESYLLVNEYSPSFELEFESLIQAARVNYDIGNNDESLEILEDLFDEEKFEEHLDFIQLEMGLNYYEMGRIEEAKNIFIEVDSTYTSSEAVGIADYSLGKMWEFHLMNYDSAKFYYKLATISPAPIDYKDSAKVKMEIFDKYYFLKGEYESNNKKLYYSMNPEEFVKDSIAHAEYLVRLNDYLEEKRLEEEANSTSGIPTDLGVTSTAGASNPQNVGGASQQQGTVAGRRNPPQTATNPRSGNKNSTAGERAKMLANDLPADLVEVPEPPTNNLSADSLKSLIIKKELELGNLFFTDFEVPDSAETYYRKIVEGDSTHRLFPNALFALASLSQTRNKDSEANSLFQTIYDHYPLSTVYIEAAKKLGLVEEENVDDPSEELFIAAEKLYYNSEKDSAITSLYDIVNKHPSSKFAPKALYTIGFILENEMLLLDSAASVYASLTEMYSSSEFAKSISGKLNTYTAEKGFNSKDSVQIEQKLIIADSSSINSGKAVVPDSTSMLDNVRANKKNINKSKHIRESGERGNRSNKINEDLSEGEKTNSQKAIVPDSTGRLDKMRTNNMKELENIKRIKELEESKGQNKSTKINKDVIDAGNKTDSTKAIIPDSTSRLDRMRSNNMNVLENIKRLKELKESDESGKDSIITIEDIDEGDSSKVVLPDSTNKIKPKVNTKEE